MDPVVVAPDAAGLAEMLGELIRTNLRDDPARRELIAGRPATVNLRVRDVGVDVGIRFTGTTVEVGDAGERADLAIACDAATLMELTAVPLRFGMPDTLTVEGRRVTRKLLNGQIAVRGLPAHLPLMVRLQRLVTVTR